MNLIEDARVIERFREEMRGVFTLSDLKVIFPSKQLVSFYRRLACLEKAKVLRRFTRGVYVTEKFDLSAVSQKLCPKSYVSFETVLAKHLLIGTVPKHKVRTIKVGKRREYRFQSDIILQVGVASHLYFGFETIGGINFATKEKALLDTLYFHTKGMTFYFDLYSDVDLSCIDEKIIGLYLESYKNPRFIKFVKTYFKPSCQNNLMYRNFKTRNVRPPIKRGGQAGTA